MTSINFVEHGDVLWMFGDGASYDAEGVLTGISGKSHLIPSLSTALLFSGRSICAPYIAHMIASQFNDFDELRAGIADFLPDLVQALVRLFDDDPKDKDDAGQRLRLFCGGWSAAKGATAAFQIATNAGVLGAGQRIVPYTVIDTSGLMQPGLTAEQRARCYGGTPVVNADSIENIAISTLEMQRQAKHVAGKTVDVGGLVELVTVRRDQLEARILHRWAEDKVGELMLPRHVDWDEWRGKYPVPTDVNPTVGMVDPTAGMSRLQREMFLKKQAKKAKRSAA